MGSSHQHKETTGKLYVLIILSQNKVYNLACLFQKKIILNGLHFKCQIQMVYIMYISMSPIMHNGLAKEKNRATGTNTSSILFFLLRGPLCLRIINFSPFKYPLILASEERSFEGSHKLLFFLNLARSAIKENHK